MWLMVHKVALRLFFFSSEYLGPLSVSFRQYSILIFIDMLLLPEDERMKPGHLQKTYDLSDYGENKIEKNLHLIYRDKILDTAQFARSKTRTMHSRLSSKQAITDRAASFLTYIRLSNQSMRS
jgi:hypothetical protein